MDRVITGEVLRGTTVVLPLPKKSRRRGPWIVGSIAAVMACCVAVPVLIFAVPIIRDTLEAGKGSTSPQEALLKFMFTMEPPAEARRLEAERTIVAKHRKTISKQRTDYINTIAADNRRHPDTPARIVIGGPTDHVDIRGDNATVTSHYAARWELTSGAAYQSDGIPWTATAQRQRDGWRLTSITMPPWCGTLHDDGTATGYAKC